MSMPTKGITMGDYPAIKLDNRSLLKSIRRNSPIVNVSRGSSRIQVEHSTHSSPLAGSFPN